MTHSSSLAGHPCLAREKALNPAAGLCDWDSGTDMEGAAREAAEVADTGVAWAGEQQLVSGVHHVQLSYPPRAQQAMERFYRELLGLSRLVVAGRPGLSFLAGGQRIDLLPYKGQAGAAQGVPGGLVHLALTVRDVDALRQRLLVHGGLALDVAPVTEGRRCYARDPAGNLIEMLELPAHAAALA